MKLVDCTSILPKLCAAAQLAAAESGKVIDTVNEYLDWHRQKRVAYPFKFSIDSSQYAELSKTYTVLDMVFDPTRNTLHVKDEKIAVYLRLCGYIDKK